MINTLQVTNEYLQNREHFNANIEVLVTVLKERKWHRGKARQPRGFNASVIFSVLKKISSNMS